MSLAAGTMLGPYEILEAIGAGGMGEVYRARDTKLNRDVAIKVLLQAVANDAERLARFQREAQILASLNHPNIAHIHGLEESEGVRALVMELVEGPTLADRIAQGPIALADAIAIAKQIADALEAAHDQGVIHRDLKPANVKVREDGTVKVLDFGLAKAFEPAASSSRTAMNSPTLTAATMHGEILGTAAYMSPEQARGKAVDKRADIWAFGCVLYEMLTGKRMFQGEDTTDILVEVIKSEPDWDALPAETPFLIRRLLRHCVTKDHRQRLGDIRDARIELSEAQNAPAMDGGAAQPARNTGRERLAWIAAAVFGLTGVPVLALFGMGVIHVRETPAETPVVRFTLAFPEGAAPGRPVISPDGRRLVFANASTGLWVRALDALPFQLLPGTTGAVSPFWSPDSKNVGFFADGKLKKVDLVGGPALTLCDALNLRGGAWSPTGVIVFAPSVAGALQKVSAAGGIPASATAIGDTTDEVSHRWPQFLPDGRHFVYASQTPSGSFVIFVASLDSPSGTPLGPANSDAGYAAPGFLVFMSGTTLMRRPFDATRLRFTGDAAPVAEGVGVSANGGALFSVSSTGVLVYTTASATEKRRVVWVDRQGAVTPLPLTPDTYGEPSLSPDGRRIAMAKTDASGSHIWVYDIERGTQGKRTFEGVNAFPLWSPDGQFLTFSRGVGMVGPLMRVRADGTGQPEALVTDAQRPGLKVATSWSADGQLLAFLSARDMFVRDAKGAVQPVLATPAYETEGRFAPGGHWLAYRSDESGRSEVYVQSYPTGGGKWQISVDGGAQPMWAPGGAELFYKSQNKMMVVAVEAGATFSVGSPKVLFEMPMPERTPTDPARYVVTPDAKRFLVLTTAGDDAGKVSAPQINVVLNWPATVTSKAATK